MTISNLMESLRKKLIDEKWIDDTCTYSELNYINKKKLIINNLNIEESTITSKLERLLFLITSSENIKSILVLGSYWGYSALWLYNFERKIDLVGYDVSKKDIKISNVNKNILEELFKSPLNMDYQYRDVLIKPYNKKKFDLIFVDIDVNGSKKEYIECIENWGGFLEKDGLILLHDSYVPKFENDFNDIHLYLKNKDYRYLTLPIDQHGIDLVKFRGFKND